MTFTGPTIIAGIRPLRILSLVGVTSARGPSYARGQAVLTMTGSARYHLRRSASGISAVLLSGTATASLLRGARGTGSITLSGAGQARRRRRVAGAASMLVSATGSAGRRRSAAGAATLAATAQGAAFVRPGWATPGSAVDLDFRGNRGFQSGTGPAALGSILTVVRSTVGYIDDSAGNWTLVPANTLRRSDKGVLIEGAQNNIALWSSDLSQAAWTKTGATAVLGQTGIDGNLNASLLTATAANGQATQAITSASALRTTSVFLRRVTGSSAVQITQDGSTWTTVAVTSAWQRFQLPSVTAANPVVGVRLATAGDAVAVDIVQHEVWSTSTTTVGGASSPIRTVGAAANRAADVVTFSLAAAPTALTLAGVFRASPFPVLFGGIALAGSGSDTIQFGRRNTTGTNVAVVPVAGGVQQSAVSYPGIAESERFAMAAAITAGDEGISVNGTAAVTTTATAMPAGLTGFQLGQGNGRAWYGYLERLVLLPVRAVNTELQRLSTLATWGG